MKIMGMKNIHITILLVFCCSPNSFGQTAKYVSTTIGTQVWMAENLNADKFRNGDQIPEEKTKEEWLSAENEKKPAWCYVNNNAANGEKYGKLYNWYAVIDPRGLAPKGWHVPTDEEWKALIGQLGGEEEAGEKMKSADGWGTNRWGISRSVNHGTNENGFNALPGSRRAYDGTFGEVGDIGYWWSATPFASTKSGQGYQLGIDADVGEHIFDKCGLSVRCIKENKSVEPAESAERIVPPPPAAAR
jgi:uncharacterized protein (TIGR02145 family)